ncbi:RPII140-upstream gene protein-like [Paramacrobiotus metropolitanus]|uniref:RPII140-upstream gene protein-like n=1 Tax=Paramacrobiotus metropolitanus TaxID=2943436 RepID=UPI00244569E0|nr:RPII140-upstream gene protein-like [Paramacrobiotus metropolitanus]
MVRITHNFGEFGNIEVIKGIDYPLETPPEEKGNIFERYILPNYTEAKARLRRSFGFKNDDPELFSAAALQESLDDSTAWNRIKNIFKYDANDQISGEFLMIKHSTIAALIVGAVMGGWKGVNGIRERFIKYHQATIFERELEAQMRMIDTVAYHGFRSALKYALKYGFFMFSFTTISAMAVAARQESGIVENTIAGTITGVVHRPHMGIRAAVTAGTLGGVLGTCAGALLYGSRKLTGRTYEETAYWVKMGHVNRYRSHLETEYAKHNGPLVSLFGNKKDGTPATATPAMSPLLQSAQSTGVAASR